MTLVKTHEDLEVFQHAIDAAMLVFRQCRRLPESERRELGTQWLRCSRSVAANIAEAWRKRYYPAHFLSKLSDAEAEAAEAQVWLLICLRCDYIDDATFEAIHRAYDLVLRQLVVMARNPERWSLRPKRK